jgi:hypothetical protein
MGAVELCKVTTAVAALYFITDIILRMFYICLFYASEVWPILSKNQESKKSNFIFINRNHHDFNLI